LTDLAQGKQRCYLVYAIAPDGVTARQANDLFNKYVDEGERGTAIFHDHFTGKPHGGVAVFDVRDSQAYELLGDHRSLDGWSVSVHPLTYSLTAVGFGALVEFCAKTSTGKSLAELAAEEPRDERFWWVSGG
jgi:hypothetical protein